jgi:hypothetical protein
LRALRIVDAAATLPSSWGAAMKEINHLVLAAHNLEALRATYAALGFTLCPTGHHPFGTSNTAIQLERNYLELLAVTEPANVFAHTPTTYSFSAFNRDYLARHEGFSMLVLGTDNARGDLARWSSAGIETYEPFDFSRPARMANGDHVTVGFTLAFATNPALPWIGTFSCQHLSPSYFRQPEYQRHANTALGVADVWICGGDAEELAGYFATLADSTPEELEDRTEIPTAAGTIILAEAEAFEAAFGVPPPHPQDGPHLAGYTIACRNLDFFAGRNLSQIGERLVVPPVQCFGTALGFTSKR